MRSPKRRKTVPLPTDAAAATASIVTLATPRSSTRRVAASSSRARLRAASARSCGPSGPDVSSSSTGWVAGSGPFGKGCSGVDMNTA